MKLRHSIRLRFLILLIAFSLIITIVSAVAITVVQRSMVEDVLIQRLESELQHFSNGYLTDKHTPLPHTRDLKGFLGVEALPSYLREFVSTLPDGIYFYEPGDDDFRGRPLQTKLNKLNSRLFHNGRDRLYRSEGFNDPEGDVPPVVYVAVKALSDTMRLYLMVDPYLIEMYIEESERHMAWVMLLICLAGAALALMMAHRVTHPLKRLANVIETSGPDNLPTGFSSLFHKDEIGTVAGALERSMERVRDFMARELRFTRDASHELRTPVTVVKGALELLQVSSAPEDKMVRKLLERVERSVIDMETTIESLLWLARENLEDQAAHPCKLLPIVENAVEKNRHLIVGKPIEMKLKTEAEPVLTLPPGILSIAVSNLIRNACHYTVEGSITVRLKKDRIEVEDTGIGIDEQDLSKVEDSGYAGSESKGFGFGLDIVKRLCDRMQWELKIESQAERGSLISLIFKI